MEKSEIAILGAGAYGTALASAFAREGKRVRIWARNADVVNEINLRHTNKSYLGEGNLPECIEASKDINEVVEDARVLIYACTSNAFREMLSRIKSSLLKKDSKTLFVNTAKGLDAETLRSLYFVVKKEMGSGFAKKRYLNLSGPSFAAEIFRGVPTCVTLASEGIKTARVAQLMLGTPNFRPYITTDVIGCEMGGATKNVIAIAAGIVEGMKLGHNANAAIINLGFAELTHIGQSFGGKVETFLGLSGMGDLMLTCYGGLSRNRRFGIALGEGQSLAEAKETVGSTIEGIYATQNIHRIAEKRKLNLPICQEIHRIIYEDKAPQAALRDLLQSPSTFER